MNRRAMAALLVGLGILALAGVAWNAVVADRVGAGKSVHVMMTPT